MIFKKWFDFDNKFYRWLALAWAVFNLILLVVIYMLIGEVIPEGKVTPGMVVTHAVFVYGSLGVGVLLGLAGVEHR